MSNVAITVNVYEFCRLKLINYNVLVTVLLSTVIPQLTSDPANEFFG